MESKTLLTQLVEQIVAESLSIADLAEMAREIQDGRGINDIAISMLMFGLELGLRGAIPPK